MEIKYNKHKWIFVSYYFPIHEESSGDTLKSNESRFVPQYVKDTGGGVLFAQYNHSARFENVYQN